MSARPSDLPDPGAPEQPEQHGAPARPETFAEWQAGHGGGDSEAEIVREMTALLKADREEGIAKLKNVQWRIAERFLTAQARGYVKAAGGVIPWIVRNNLGSHQYVYSCVGSLKLEKEKHDFDQTIEWFRRLNSGWQPRDGNFGPKKAIEIVKAYRKRFDEPAPVKTRETGPTRKQLIERLARRTQQLIRVMDEERKIAADADRVPLVLNPVMGELEKEQEEERLPDIVPPAIPPATPPETETPPATETAPETPPPTDSTAVNPPPKTATTANTSPEAPAKRGRPPRKGAAIPPEPTAKRPRGRPRKNATPASAPDSTALNHSPSEASPAIPPETETAAPGTVPSSLVTEAVLYGIGPETEGAYVPPYRRYVAFNNPDAVEWQVVIWMGGQRITETFPTLAEALKYGNEHAEKKLKFFKHKPRHSPPVYFKKAEVKRLLPGDPKE